MATSIAKKLRISDGMNLLTMHAPKDFVKIIGVLPSNVNIDNSLKKFDQLHWFVTNKEQLDKETPKILSLLKDDMFFWIYYPKSSSALQTDLTRDKGWEGLVSKGKDLIWLSLISFNETWSVFGLRKKTASDLRKEITNKPREILKWIDPEKKIVRLPEDLKKLLATNKKAKDNYEALAYSHRKEYVEWIITAKKNETRKKRITDMIASLEKGWKTFRG